MDELRLSVLIVVMALCTAATVAQTSRVYELDMEGKRVGYSRFTRAKAAQGVATSCETSIRVSLLGAPFDMLYHTSGLHSPDGRRLIRYKVDLKRGADAVTVSCTVKGKTVHLVGTISGKTTTKDLPWTPDTFVIEGNSMDTWDTMVAAWGASIPTQVRILAPLGGVIQILTIKRLGAETVKTPFGPKRCDRVRVEDKGTVIELVITQGKREVVEMRVPDQKAVFKLADASALTGITAFDVAARLFSVVNEPLPPADKLTYLKIKAHVEVVGERPTTASLQSATQKFAGAASNGLIDGVFEVTPYRYTPANPPLIAAMPAKDARLAPYLKAEPNVECNDPEIRALAAKIISGSETSWDAVIKIGEWVKQNIAYAITGCGALECLHSKRGDCGPHTWLTIALCRAAGIPARMTGGLLYSEALGGSFGQHYWTRVWMGPDGWVPIDTTTHEVGTLSPAHITLWNLAGLKSVSVTVLDYAPKPEAPKDIPQGRSYRPQVGDSERWVFLVDGKEIGEQTARCGKADTEGGRAYSDWTYNLAIEAGGQKVAMLGGYSVWEDGAPRKLTFDADVAGTRQTGQYTFTGDKVDAQIKIGQTPVSRSITMQRGVLLQMNNLLSLFSITMRSVPLEAGQTRAVPFFAAGTMQKVDLTFRCQPEPRKLTVMGKDRSCIVCDVEPIQNRFFLDASSGELLRIEVPAGKLVIERR